MELVPHHAGLRLGENGVVCFFLDIVRPPQLAAAAAGRTVCPAPTHFAAPTGPGHLVANFHVTVAFTRAHLDEFADPVMKSENGGAG